MNNIKLSLSDKYIMFNTIIGKGTSYIYLGKNTYTNEKVAIKVINITKTNKKYVDNEIKILESINSPYIIKLYNYFYIGTVLYLVMEYCSDGDLTNYKPTKFSEENIKIIFSNIIDGLAYLHDNHIYHRDIKPQNILIKGDVFKICDLGFAIRKCNIKDTTGICGSPIYMAPEILLNRKYVDNSDIWSLGIMLYEMINKTLPFSLEKCTNIKELIHNLKINKLSINNTQISENCMNIIQLMLVKNHNNRIDWIELQSHLWLRKQLLLENITINEDYFASPIFTTKFKATKTQPIAIINNTKMNRYNSFSNNKYNNTKYKNLNYSLYYNDSI